MRPNFEELGSTKLGACATTYDLEPPRCLLSPRGETPRLAARSSPRGCALPERDRPQIFCALPLFENARIDVGVKNYLNPNLSFRIDIRAKNIRNVCRTGRTIVAVRAPNQPCAVTRQFKHLSLMDLGAYCLRFQLNRLDGGNDVRFCCGRPLCENHRVDVICNVFLLICREGLACGPVVGQRARVGGCGLQGCPCGVRCDVCCDGFLRGFGSHIIQTFLPGLWVQRGPVAAWGRGKRDGRETEEHGDRKNKCGAKNDEFFVEHFPVPVNFAQSAIQQPFLEYLAGL